MLVSCPAWWMNCCWARAGNTAGERERCLQSAGTAVAGSGSAGVWALSLTADENVRTGCQSVQRQHCPLADQNSEMAAKRGLLWTDLTVVVAGHCLWIQQSDAVK